MKVEKLNQLREWRTLFNPAFCGEILRNTIKEYEKHDSKGLPFTLVFFVLPLILHQDTFDKIRLTQQGQFFSWLDTQFSKTLDFEDRTRLLKGITLESLSFLSFHNAIMIEDGKLRTVDFEQSTSSTKYSPYMRKYQDKAIQVGRWFSQSDSVSTIYLMLGVKP